MFMVAKKGTKVVTKSKGKIPSKKVASTKKSPVKNKTENTKVTKKTVEPKNTAHPKPVTFKKYLPFILAILFAGAAFYVYNDGLFTDNTESNLISIEEFARQEALETRLEEQYTIDRSTYGLGTIYDAKTGDYKQFNIIDIFKNLPAVPDDFWRMKYEMSSGQIAMKTLADMDKAYYLQPEFIKNNFVDGGINFWISPDIYHWYPEGYGTYPHQAYVETTAGGEFDVYTFTYTSWGVEGYQGLSLVPAYPERIVNPEGDKIDTDPTLAKEYFTISISPDTVLLEPTYPIFSKDWSKKIYVHVEIAEDTPTGVYAIGYDVASAPSDLEDTWQDQYRELYQSKSGFSIPTAQFEIYVNVQ